MSSNPSLPLSSRPLASRIASLVLSRFDKLPRKAKPRIEMRPDGSMARREWVTLCGVVVVDDNADGDRAPDTDLDTDTAGEKEREEKLWCVCLATGAKALPRSAIPRAHGRILHDSHAEILALRAFNYFLLNEIERMLLPSPSSPPSPSPSPHCHPDIGSSPPGKRGAIVAYDSPFLERQPEPETETEPDEEAELPTSSHLGFRGKKRTRKKRPFKLRDGLTVHLFCTEPPCGDASMESLMNTRGAEGAVPWTREQRAHAENGDGGGGGGTYRGSGCGGSQLQGRGYFSELGVVRRKPGRADAEISLSKSCSDKFAVREVTGILNGCVDALVEPIWVQSLVLPYGKAEKDAMKRAFAKEGRLKGIDGRQIHNGYGMRPFVIEVLSSESPRFAFEKPDSEQSKASNVASVWIAGENGDATGTCEVLINGVKQGFKQDSESSRKSSMLCRESMWKKGRRAVKLLREMPDYRDAVEDLQPFCSTTTYTELKQALALSGRHQARERAVEILGQWHPNRGDEFWGLDTSGGNSRSSI